MTDVTSRASRYLADLADAGVSVWLDECSRGLLSGGGLQRLIDERGVVGVTTNPTIFATALSTGEDYAEQIAQLARAGTDVEEAVIAITTQDVRVACDIFRPLFDATGGQDGRVSIEVDPRLARDTEGTIAAARRLWSTVDQPNVMIKIPATVEGLPAISTAITEGINVNVTLIFDLDRYRGVMNAFLTGLEQARLHGLDLSAIHSVASFFVSRVDSEVDARLARLDAPEAAQLRGKAGVANARLAYRAYEEVFATPRWANLADDGAHAQRPLWASTGVKDPSYPDTLYVTELVAPNTVNTMPRATLEAVADHGEISGDSVRGSYDAADVILDDLERLGISYHDVVETLEREGVEKFEASWQQLLERVSVALASARQT